MITIRSDVFDVPLVEGTVLQDREANSYQRTFVLRNIGSSALTIKIEYSDDGGATWTLIGSSFILGIPGSGTEIVTKNITSGYILRVRGSNGGNDRDLLITLMNTDLDANHIWTSPMS